MGQDKALLKLPDGQSLLGQTVGVARSLLEAVGEDACWRSDSKGVAPSLAVVTPWPKRYQAAIAPPVQWIEDSREAGPLAGFIQAWAEIQSDWCLLLACDLPNLDAQVLQRWWQWLVVEATVRQCSFKGASSMPSAEASLVKRSGRWEPLCGYYHRSCIPGLTHYLASGRLDFQSWLPTLTIAPYLDMPEEMLFNCNRPADWAKVTR